MNQHNYETFPVLPTEILVKIFENLSIGDLIVTSMVCSAWKDIAAIVLAEKVSIVIGDDFSTAVNTITKHGAVFKHWVLKGVDLNGKQSLCTFCDLSKNFTSLALLDVEMHEKDLLELLRNCSKLQELSLAGLAHIFMPGTFLEDDSQVNALEASLKCVRRLSLSCSRYLTDLLFSRIGAVLQSLDELSLSGCQICYQNSIWKRFYPTDGRVAASDHVLTFNFILKFIECHKNSLKSLDLSRTGMDSDSLIKLSKIPNLQLEKIYLRSCDQLTKLGVQILTQNQPHLVEIDIGSCSRVTDYSVIAIADNLPALKVLNIAGCHSVSEVGIENLSRLVNLERLDISHLAVQKWESIHDALGKVSRPSLRHLNVASIPIQWETVSAFGDLMPNLEYLDLSMCIVGVTDRSIQVICKSLVHLKHLFLSGCIGISDIGLAGHGGGAADVPLLNVGGNELSLESLGIVSKNPYKVPLGLKAEQLIRKEGEVRQYLEQNIDQVLSSECGLSHLNKLRELNLCGCLRITDLTLIHALRFTELRFLSLAHCQQISDEGLIGVAVYCPSLEELHLTDCSCISDNALLVISHRLKRIKTLDLQRCTSLTNDALDSLSSCHLLRYLDVSGCHKMSLEGVYEIKSRIPRLINFHYRGIKALNDKNFKDEPWTNIQLDAPTPPPLLHKLKKRFCMQ